MPIKAFMNYIEMMDTHVLSSTTDLQGCITSVSQAYCNLTGYSREELIGKTHEMMRDEKAPSSLYTNMWGALTRGESWQGELRNKRKDGSYFWVYAHISPNYDTLGNRVGYIAVRQDITDHKRVQELMLIDELTQLYNRRHFNQVLDSMVENIQSQGNWFGFLMLDADHFKKYNDTYGHQMGDDVLVAIGECLKESFNGSYDAVFRLGGEEFCALYCGTSFEHLIERAERARIGIMNRAISHSGNPPANVITVSMGLMSLDPNQRYVVEELYKYADEALYKAKQNGRNRLELVSNEEADVELF